MIRIGIDAMGSDKGSVVFIEACKRFVKDFPVKLEIYGNEAELSELKTINNITIHHTSEVMAMTDGPLAVRRKKDSSMVRAVTDLVDGNCDGVLSCGGTGALLSCGVLLAKMIEGVEKPAIMTFIPTVKNRASQLLDVGANPENSAEQLYGFAKMAKCYAHAVLGYDNPSIGLLNIGGEKTKGDQVRKDAYQLLEDDKDLNFVGNIEADNVLYGQSNIIVADGFSGNILLKGLEGTGKFVMKKLKENLYSSFISKLGALLAKSAFIKTKDFVENSDLGGAMILGINKPIVKAHGSAVSKDIYSGLVQLYKIIDNNVIEKLKEELK